MREPGYNGAFDRRTLRFMIPGVDNVGTLAWLEESLRYARDGTPSGIEGLLEAVRAEILFELELYERPWPDGENGRGG